MIEGLTNDSAKKMWGEFEIVCKQHGGVPDKNLLCVKFIVSEVEVYFLIDGNIRLCLSFFKKKYIERDGGIQCYLGMIHPEVYKAYEDFLMKYKFMESMNGLQDD